MKFNKILRIRLPFNYELLRYPTLKITYLDQSGFKKTIENRGFNHELIYFMLLQLNKPTEIEFDVLWKFGLKKSNPVKVITHGDCDDLW